MKFLRYDTRKILPQVPANAVQRSNRLRDTLVAFRRNRIYTVIPRTFGVEDRVAVLAHANHINGRDRGIDSRIRQRDASVFGLPWDERSVR